jgi:hypothetical protein
VAMAVGTFNRLTHFAHMGRDYTGWTRGPPAGAGGLKARNYDGGRGGGYLAWVAAAAAVAAGFFGASGTRNNV